jgi:hypothetical protein
MVLFTVVVQAIVQRSQTHFELKRTIEISSNGSLSAIFTFERAKLGNSARLF